MTSKAPYQHRILPTKLWFLSFFSPLFQLESNCCCYFLLGFTLELQGTLHQSQLGLWFYGTLKHPYKCWSQIVIFLLVVVRPRNQILAFIHCDMLMSSLLCFSMSFFSFFQQHVQNKVFSLLYIILDQEVNMKVV